MKKEELDQELKKLEKNFKKILQELLDAQHEVSELRKRVKKS